MMRREMADGKYSRLMLEYELECLKCGRRRGAAIRPDLKISRPYCGMCRSTEFAATPLFGGRGT